MSYFSIFFNFYKTFLLVLFLNTKTQLKNTYLTFGAGWTAQNTDERIPQI